VISDCYWNWYKGIASSDCRRRCHLGYDRVFAVNYLGHFLLVNRLLPLLIHSAPSRIVSVASIAHAFLHEPLFDDESAHAGGHADRRAFCRRLAGYEASKLAMLLHVKELSRRLGGLYLCLSPRSPPLSMSRCVWCVFTRLVFVIIIIIIIITHHHLFAQSL